MVWQLAIVVPLFSLFIERVLELFDTIVVLTLFPQWRKAPLPPPAMLLKKPWEEARDPNQKPYDKIVYAVGSNRLELTINTYKEAEFYYRRAERFHQQRLVYYIAKYGHFLLDKDIRRAGRLVEALLARREGVPQPPDMAEIAKRIVDTSARTSITADMSERTPIADLLATEKGKEFKNKAADTGQSPQENLTPKEESEGETADTGQSPQEDLTQKLELWADYCYLRNQRTYEAFALLKRRVYLVLGSLLGVWIAYQAYQIVPGNPGMSSSGYSNPTGSDLEEMGRVWWLLGGVGGAVSTLAHGIVSFILKKTTPPVEASPIIDGIVEIPHREIISPG